jgi:hypothetical protein
MKEKKLKGKTKRTRKGKYQEKTLGKISDITKEKKGVGILDNLCICCGQNLRVGEDEFDGRDGE